MERELATRMRRVVVYSILASPGLLAAFVYLGVTKPIWSASHYAVIGSLSTGMTALLLWWLFRLQYSPVRIDEELTMRAAELAARLGVSPKEVWITEAFFAPRPLGLLQSRRRFLVTPRLLEMLTPKEMDFVLTQQLAQRPAISMRAFVPLAASMIIYVLLLMAIVFEAFWRYLLVIPMAWAGVWYVMLYIELWKSGFTRNHMADLRAIEITKNRDAAISFLTKFARAKRGDRLSGTTASHMAKRLEMLRASS